MTSLTKSACIDRLRLLHHTVLNRRSSICRAFALSVLCSVGILSGAYAQTDPDLIYSAKFVCGAQRAPLSLALPRDPGLLDVQPGSYATVLNIMNLYRFAPRVKVQASLAQSSPSAFANTRVIRDQAVPVFGAMKVGCADIAAAFGRNNSDVFDGFLYIIQPQDYLNVQAVYTYSEQDEFQSQRFIGIGVNNQVGDINAPAPGSNSNVTTGFRIMGGAGAGGLGIGNSIHIERITPRAMPTPPVLDPIILPKTTH